MAEEVALFQVKEEHEYPSCLTFTWWRWRWSCSVMSDSLWPRGLSPTRLLRPWDSPGKNTGHRQAIRREKKRSTRREKNGTAFHAGVYKLGRRERSHRITIHVENKRGSFGINGRNFSHDPDLASRSAPFHECWSETVAHLSLLFKSNPEVNSRN